MLLQFDPPYDLDVVGTNPKFRGDYFGPPFHVKTHANAAKEFEILAEIVPLFLPWMWIRQRLVVNN